MREREEDLSEKEVRKVERRRRRKIGRIEIVLKHISTLLTELLWSFIFTLVVGGND